MHDSQWWINKFEAFGFKYSESMTQQVRQIASQERQTKGQTGPDGKQLNAQHVWLNMQVFINPIVASLPEHAHLFSEQGCYKEREKGGKIVHKECGTLRGGEGESVLPASFYPLALTEEDDQQWLKQVKESIVGDKEA